MNLRPSFLFAAITFCGLSVCPRIARAELGQNGDPINTSRYAVDLYQGPVLASTRVIGLGGAYVAIAEGVEGSFYNPAAPAVRTSYSHRHIDYDLGAGLTFPSTLQSSDFFNSGGDRTNIATSSSREFTFFDAEGHLQFGPYGIGSGVALQQYDLRRDPTSPADLTLDRLRAQFYVVLVQAARATANGQLIVGAGLRPTGLSLVSRNSLENQTSTRFSTQGIGYAAGFLWRPNDAIFRVGASFTTSVHTAVGSASAALRDANGNLVLKGSNDNNVLYLPERVGLPWELNFGVATQFGARPFNPRWVDPEELLVSTRRRLEWRHIERQRSVQAALEQAKINGQDVRALEAQFAEQEKRADAADERELSAAKRQVDKVLRDRERKLGRWYILLSTSMRICGPIADAVGVESFLQRVVDRSGRRAVVEPHIGLESEVISGWLKLRAGAYGEPSRFDNLRSRPRIHTTLGAEQKLFGWDVFGLYREGTSWRVQAAIDLSERYFGWSGSVGVWH